MESLKKLTSDVSPQTSQLDDPPKSRHYAVNSNGRIGEITCTYDSCPCKKNDYLVSSKGYGQTFPAGTIGGIKNDSIAVNDSASVEAFKFLADSTNVEWGMTVCPDSLWIYTSYKNEHVGLLEKPNMTQMVHSHLLSASEGDELSQQDKDNVERYRDIKHTLYYNGRFRDFNNISFYGNWRYGLE